MRSSRRVAISGALVFLVPVVEGRWLFRLGSPCRPKMKNGRSILRPVVMSMRGCGQLRLG